MTLSRTLRIEYFRDQLVVWRIVGALDLSEGNFWSWAMLLTVIVFLTPFLLTMMLFSFEDNIDNILNLSMTITSISIILRFLLYVANLTKLFEIQWLIGRLDERISGEEEVKRHQAMAKHLQRISKLFLVIYGILFTNAAFSFLLEEERSLPLPMWIPFDWKNSTAGYAAALFLQQIGIFIQVLQSYAGDSFPPLALYLLSEQCQLLILRFSNVGYGSKTLKENEEDLVNCIRNQNTLYSLMEAIHGLISYPMFVQLFVIGINVAVACFGLVFYVVSFSDRAFFLCFLMVLILQSYPLCYYGTVLEESFAELHYAVFCSNWVDQSMKYKKLMLIISERTKRKQLLLAGNLVPIHLSTFVACWKGAYSFFTLMADRDGRNA
ncbi:odorant receptor 23a [Drosophila ficusphila]|uniref:odorant receptor 23a n=1 Tax=Drosophila ficusphila TaxID=30025 RepID=UPI0007E879DC|nr:odorant receptor 23a [Drosophila ficusphila]